MNLFSLQEIFHLHTVRFGTIEQNFIASMLMEIFEGIEEGGQHNTSVSPLALGHSCPRFES